MTAGRRVALAIGVPLCLALTANPGLDLVADVGRGTVPVDYHLPAAARRVSVTTSGGRDVVVDRERPAADVRDETQTGVRGERETQRHTDRERGAAAGGHRQHSDQPVPR